MGKKLALVLIVASAIVGFFYFDLAQYLTLDSLRARKDLLQNLYRDHQVTAALGFVAIYIVMAALSLPGALVLTLAGGAVFGVLLGSILVSIGSTLGASCAFLAARYLLGDSLQRRYADKLETFNEGVRKEGAFYLFTLRLIPAFPFFLINLVMGLTPLSLRTFFWVSQVGMLPGTVVYVNAGTRLSQLESLKGILSVPLIMSFVAIGLLPMVSKKIIRLWQRPAKS